MHGKAKSLLLGVSEIKTIHSGVTKTLGGSGGKTVGPRRLSFSQFVVLMCTTNCEKDSLLGQTVFKFWFPESGFFFETLWSLQDMNLGSEFSFVN